MNSADSRLHGVFTALVTPRRPRSIQIEVSAAIEIVDFLQEAGVDGLVAMGSTGEVSMFDSEERIRFAAAVVHHSRIPVVVSTAHSSLRGALMLAQAAADAGAAGILLMPPYFFRYRQAEIEEFFLRFADEAPAGVPVYLYNIPFFTTVIERETASRLLATGRFAGIKDSSGNFDYLKALIDGRTGDQRLIVGNDTAYAPLRQVGADGVVSGCSCAVPELLVALDRTIRAGKIGPAAGLNERLHEFIRWIDNFPGPMGVKEAAAVRGLPAHGPVARLSPDLETKLVEFRSWFRDWLPGVNREASEGIAAASSS